MYFKSFNTLLLSCVLRTIRIGATNKESVKMNVQQSKLLDFVIKKANKELCEIVHSVYYDYTLLKNNEVKIYI